LDDFQPSEEQQLSKEEREELEQAWQQAQETQKSWAEEFFDEAERDRLEEEAWFAQFLPNKGSKWTQEFERFDRDEPEDEKMRAVAQRFSKIQDPKLRNSNFMRFVEQIRDGEVKVVGSKVIPQK
jgi:hypothetical protein